jgi:hypothetical protein
VAMQWASTVFGEEAGTLEKVYSVYFCKNFIVSLYQVTGHPEIYLEVEADNLSTVSAVATQLAHVYDLRQEMRSLFNIIFGDKK